MNSRRGFTLVETLVVLLFVIVMVAVHLLAAAGQRSASSVRSDLMDLRMIGQASAMYSEANQGRLFTFSWEAGVAPSTPNTELAIACANLDPNDAANIFFAAALQQLDLVTRNSDFSQITPDVSLAGMNHSPYVLYNHLILADMLGENVPSGIFTSSRDLPRNYWQSDPDSFLNNPLGRGYRPPTNSTEYTSLWRWVFSSSYMPGPSHYANGIGNVDGLPRTAQRFTPANGHRVWEVPSDPSVIGNRSMDDVLRPSSKVMMFDEYDRYTTQFGRYHGFHDTSTTMVFYDGSVGYYPTSASNYGFQPNNPDRGANTPDQATMIYFYSPFRGYDPPNAVRTRVAAYYDQTRDGLQGIDFDQGSIRKPIRSSP